MGIFTELGCLYAKYKAEKLMEHLKLFSTRINIPKLIRVCETQQHWKELTFLYIQYDEYDNAAQVKPHIRDPILSAQSPLVNKEGAYLPVYSVRRVRQRRAGNASHQGLRS